MPDWTLDEMIERSDAVVIGTVAEELAVKTHHGHAPPGKTPRYNREFKDYELTVERTFYSSEELPGAIAVLTGPQVVSSNQNTRIAEIGDIPTFATKERVLLFLDGLDDPMYNEGPGVVVPDGYENGDYYFTIIAGNFGKLMEREGRWADTRSYKTVSVERIKETVEQVKGTN